MTAATVSQVDSHQLTHNRARHQRGRYLANELVATKTQLQQPLLDWVRVIVCVPDYRAEGVAEARLPPKTSHHTRDRQEATTQVAVEVHRMCRHQSPGQALAAILTSISHLRIHMLLAVVHPDLVLVGFRPDHAGQGEMFRSICLASHYKHSASNLTQSFTADLFQKSMRLKPCISLLNIQSAWRSK